ncbi:hypothetical protein NOK12_39330 [Nocardioides sp. OK12]|nr:hypothetical protein NOK12_39330 [Nocardioides sp. OK12]
MHGRGPLTLAMSVPSEATTFADVVGCPDYVLSINKLVVKHYTKIFDSRLSLDRRVSYNEPPQGVDALPRK